MPMPKSVTNMATMLIALICWPSVTHAISAADKGASVMKSCP